MREAAAGLSAILDIEMNLHVKLCAGWGLSPSDLEQTAPAVEMLAYTRYVLDAGMRGEARRSMVEKKGYPDYRVKA
jgi:thiaminase/transcriptional activator TenA